MVVVKKGKRSFGYPSSSQKTLKTTGEPSLSFLFILFFTFWGSWKRLLKKVSLRKRLM
jgi:hypothetical protein